MPVQFLRLAPRRSLILTVFLVMIHVGAGLSLVSLTIPLWLKLALASGVIISCVRLGAIHAWYTSLQSVAEVSIDTHARVTLVYRSGECWQGMLAPDSYVHPLAVILRVVCRGDTRSVLLLRGQLDAEPFRRLRTTAMQTLRDQHTHEF